MTLRTVLAAVLAGTLSACGPDARQTATGQGETVLVLTPVETPVVQQAKAEIARRNELARGDRSTLGIEVRSVETGADVTAVVRSLLPQIDRYRVIFTPSHTYARAAQLLVHGRPIVFDGVDDPVANCLVDSLRHPGRNATGYMHQLPDTELKMLELLHDGFPDVKQVVVLASGLNVGPQSCDPADPYWRGELPPCARGLRGSDADVRRMIEADRIEAFGRRLGLAVRFLVMCEAADFALLRGAEYVAADVGFIVPWHSLFDGNIQPLVDTIASIRRPAVYPNDRFTKAGGLLSLEPILDRGADRASVLTLMQVIDGRPPAGLPVQTPRGFETVFNADAAVAQGLRPSPLLMRRADRTLAP